MAAAKQAQEVPPEGPAAVNCPGGSHSAAAAGEAAEVCFQRHSAAAAMTSTKESMSSACLLRWLPSIVWGLAIIRVLCLETDSRGRVVFVFFVRGAMREPVINMRSPDGPSTVCVKVSGKKARKLLVFTWIWL